MRKLSWGLFALLAISACSVEEIPILVKVATSPLPDGKVTIDGTDYRVRRAIALNGRSAGEEVWAIVVKGKAYSCVTATEAGCEFTLHRAKREERRERDMGY
ncbi:MAG: hypothetical protein ABJN34_12660 [Litoreibacter sp.]|uniref:hypothetical protein n=1 Tax=Litoreibacter sp. TaxID=1969459 RepID=UPI003298DDC7